MSSILDHPLISARYFFPRREVLRDAFMVESGDVQLACYRHNPLPGAKTVVYFHGNGEVVAECVGLLARPFEQLGLNSFFAEYRGYGLSTGLPTLSGMLDDVPRMIRALGVPEEEMILFGRSVGSIYAIHALNHFPNVAGLVIESGIADPLERLLLRVAPEEMGVTIKELKSAVRERLNHREILERFTQPALFIHSRYDGLVEVDNAERLQTWAGGRKSLVVFERGDHNSIVMVNFEAYMRELDRFVHLSTK
jgi:pimeloyl-ACP methyl ester carboxylesterase